MAKAKLVTRSATTSTVTDDNLNKASALTHAEMDSNLINLRDSSFGIADDTSTVLQVTNDKTITIAGSGTVATSLSGDTLTVTGSGITATSTDTLQNKTIDTANNTITITESDISDLGSYITASSTDTLTNKTFDANGTGNSISNIETADIAAGTLVTAAEGIGSNDNDTTIPTSAAVKAYADSVGGGGGTITALNNQAENRLVSIGSTTTELDGEANLTFDGTTLTLTGSAALDGVTIADNLITTNRSNDDLLLGTNGTGRIELSADGGRLASSTTYPKYFGNADRVKGVVLSRETSTDIDALTSREYGHVIHYGTTVTNGSTSNSNWDPRTCMFTNHTNMDGNSFTLTNNFRGPTGLISAATVNNGSASSSSTLYNIRGSGINVGISDFDSPSQDLTITRVIAMEARSGVETNGSSTNTITDAYNFYSDGVVDSGGTSTNTITNLYGFYHAGTAGTNNYAFYDATNSLSVFGDIQTQAVSITDNLITTNRSNDNLNIETNGTGQIQIRANGGDFANFSTNGRYESANNLYYENLSTTLGASARKYQNNIINNIKFTTGQNSSSSNDTFRNTAETRIDLNGSSATATQATYRSRGPMGLDARSTIDNSSGTASTLGNASGGNYGIAINPSGTGNITITNTTGMGSYLDVGHTPNIDITITDHVSYESTGIDHYGSGTGNFNITDFYAFRAGAHNDAATATLSLTNNYGFYFENDSTATNTYAFYDASNSLSVFGDIQTQGVSITDNTITTNRSNDNLRLTGSGTGLPSIGPDDFFENNTLYEEYFGTPSNVKLAGMRFDQTVDADTAGRAFGLGIAHNTTVTGSSSTNSNFRQRGINAAVSVDMAGYDYTASGTTRGPQAGAYSTNVVNSSATASTINQITGASNWVAAYASNSTYAAGDITITNATANDGAVELYSGAFTGNFTITNGYAFRSDAYIDGANDTLTNMYGFYHGASSSQTGTITNNYAFYDGQATLSRFGAVILANQASDPSTVTDSAHIYAKDDAGSSEVYVRDEAGNVTKISPHNDAGEWEYYSVNKNTGKKVRVNMERMIRRLEEITGETFIESE